MKVPAEKIKARFMQLQQQGMKVQAALELNAGFNEPALRSNTSSAKLTPVREPSDQKIMTAPVNN